LLFHPLLKLAQRGERRIRIDGGGGFLGRRGCGERLLVLMPGGAGIPAAAGVLPAGTAVLLMLRSTALVLLASATGTLLRAIRLGLSSASLLCCLLAGLALLVRARPLMPAMIAVLAPAMTLPWGAALSLILLPVLCLGLTRTVPLLAILARTLPALAAI
jgi:hypothetical protein